MSSLEDLIYNELFEDRFESDYGEFSNFTEDDYQHLLPQAEQIY